MVRAFQRRNLVATVLGFVIGGVVPAATYLEAHHDIDSAVPLYAQVPTFLVVGGLLFSAKTVFAWGALAFRDRWKAAGFVLLLEGVMVTSSVPLLPVVLLVILVAINGVATGCTLSLDRRNSISGHNAGARAPAALTHDISVSRKRRVVRGELAGAHTDGQHQGDLFAA